MKQRICSIFLCCFMVVTLLTGCNSKDTESSKDDGSQVSTQPSAEVSNSPASPENSPAGNETKTTEKKKIVIVQESDDELRTSIQKKIISTLEESGFKDKETAEITEIKLAGDEKKSQEVADKIKSLKPDVAIINNSLFAYKTVGKMLSGSGIPVVLNLNIENKAMGFIDSSNKPADNITGIYSLPKDAQLSAFQLLNSICPANGKKAVFVTIDSRFNKADVEKNLKSINVELKDFCESKYVEDFKAAVTKYNNDKDVGWILIGVWPSTLKDGTTVSNLETGKWDIANRKKPSVTYFETAVKMGILAGIAIDLPETGSQAAKMAAKILNGTKVADVPAEYPTKTSIVLNKKTADTMKITFPTDILGGASKIYETNITDPNYK